MQPTDRSPLFAGGLLILFGFLAGSALGIAFGQPSLGTIVGVAIAAFLAAILWFVRRDRR